MKPKNKGCTNFYECCDLRKKGNLRFDLWVSELNKLLWISRSQPKVIGSTDTTLPCQVQQVQPVGQFDYCQDFSYLKNFFTKPFIEIQCGKMVQRIVTGLEGLQKAFQKICFVSRKKKSALKKKCAVTSLCKGITQLAYMSSKKALDWPKVKKILKCTYLLTYLVMKDCLTSYYRPKLDMYT